MRAYYFGCVRQPGHYFRAPIDALLAGPLAPVAPEGGGDERSDEREALVERVADALFREGDGRLWFRFVDTHADDGGPADARRAAAAAAVDALAPFLATAAAPSGDEAAAGDEVMTEWAVRWPGGRVFPPHLNETPIGRPTRSPLYAHRGARWVFRRVTRTPWQEWKGVGSDGA